MYLLNDAFQTLWLLVRLSPQFLPIADIDAALTGGVLCIPQTALSGKIVTAGQSYLFVQSPRNGKPDNP